MSANPHANGGTLLVDLDLPDFRDYALEFEQPAVVRRESTRELGKLLRDVYVRNAGPANFRLFCPDETNSNRLGNVFEVENRCFVGRTLDIDDQVAPDGIRVVGVSPGYTATERVMTPIRRLAEERGVAVEEFIDEFAAAQVPVGRLATADEMATWIAVLASGVAGFVTGTQLLVDGGASRAI